MIEHSNPMLVKVQFEEDMSINPITYVL